MRQIQGLYRELRSDGVRGVAHDFAEQWSFWAGILQSVL